MTKNGPGIGSSFRIWDAYPTHWPEVYYSVDLSDVGLENDLGQKQIKLLHDRRSEITINMFAPTNFNAGRGGFKTTNVKQCENGSTDVTMKDEWKKVSSVNDLMLALDNLVAGWACFWEGDRSMVTLRRAVTKLKEFAVIEKQDRRLKLLESYINKVLEINQRKAIQKDLPLKMKEVLEIGKEFLENASDSAPTPPAQVPVVEQDEVSVVETAVGDIRVKDSRTRETSRMDALRVLRV